jgi:CubicO group peptidase (beta-lactamase class C family)
VDEIEVLTARLAETLDGGGFSGVVRLSVIGGPNERVLLDRASGLADRANGRPLASDTALATASGTKGFTAVTAASLIEDGLYALDTPLVDIVGDSLPNVDPAVTVEHLLGHTSGAGDYLDEDVFDDSDAYILDLPVHQLLGPEDYLPMLLPHPQRTAPGTTFVYNNSGYIMLALVIERASGRPYHDVVAERVFTKAEMAATGFHRSDDLPPNCALGYLSDGRTNVLHLPVIGTGDGGAYTTTADMERFWIALFDGRLLNDDLVRRMTTRHPVAPQQGQGYGLGFWIGPGPVVELEGEDAGVSLLSGVRQLAPAVDSGTDTGQLCYTVIANNAADTWPLASIIRSMADGQADTA